MTFPAPSFISSPGGTLLSGRGAQGQACVASKRGRRLLRPARCARRTATFMSLTSSAVTEELSSVIETTLGLGKVTSMTRSGSSGWAVMHRATTDAGHNLFIKASREPEAMFAGEQEGLNAMHATETIRVPMVYGTGTLGTTDGSYIVMETLTLDGIFSMASFGRRLAQMHLAEPVHDEARNGQFGFAVDNTIGATPQPNGWTDNWIDFFRDRRLRHQLLLAGDGSLLEKGKRLCDRLDEFFEDIGTDIKPSLIHGDLWSGNVAGTKDDEAAIFDPACYYAHHEAEFGMSWCIQLNRAFWDEYRKLIPKAPGFDRRLKLYQLYHYLNHYNLFGGGYYSVADRLIDDLLRSLPSH